MREIVCSLALAFVCGASVEAAMPRSFTVADSISMTRIAERDDSGAPAIRIAPDGSRFVVLVRRGDLASGENRFDLLLFDTREVLRFIDSGGGSNLPSARLLRAFRTADPENPIGSIRWMADSSELAFIARDRGGIAQAFLFNIDAMSERQLTRHSSNIVAFEFSPRAENLIFSAPTAPDWNTRNRRGFTVDAESIRFVNTTDPLAAASSNIRLFVADPGTPHGVEVGAALAAAHAIEPLTVSVSPDGHWAVAAVSLKSIPKRWRAYHGYVMETTFAASLENLPPDSEDDASYRFKRPSQVRQYWLINLVTGDARPLLDAPSTEDYASCKAAWSPEGRHVLLPKTYLPLVADSMERERRLATQAVAELDTTSGRVTRVADAPDYRNSDLTAIEWLTDRSIVLRYLDRDGREHSTRLIRTHVGRWLRDVSYSQGSQGRVPIDLHVVQSLNAPAQIEAADPSTSRAQVITDLNPQLRRLSLGRGTVFRWTDGHGRHHEGGLALPVDFRADIRYPLVIQTHGLFPDEFLVDGPEMYTTAFAARALAGRGMIVLQVDEFAENGSDDSTIQTSALESWNLRAESPRAVAAYEGAIDALHAKGLIDRRRVGLIGFSRTGLYVQHMLTFSDYPVAAATIADSVSAAPSEYARAYAHPPPSGMLEFERDGTGVPSIVGAHLWGDGIAHWVERAPYFHTERVRTPLRYEAIGTGSTGNHEIFVLLKRQNRPVEMIQFPIESHILQTPIARHASQQGNVDWYAFWLQGAEDSDPAKARHYHRWRALRLQHWATLAARRH